MHQYTAMYITMCKDLGILTEDVIRKYPLRSANLAAVLKAYAITAHRPYTIDNRRFDILDEYKLYLTDAGLDWLLGTFRQYSLPYLRSVFQFVFSNATKKDIDSNKYKGYNNFKGLIGDQPKAGTKQAAVLVRSYGKDNKIKKEFPFDTIAEARQAVFELSRFYPIDQFKLYRVRTQNRYKKSNSSFREEIPIVLKESKRGLHATFGRE